MQWPKKILMIQPIGFKVAYAINPHMVDSRGQLNSVNEAKALQQWQDLREVFQSLQLQVETLAGDPTFPDMVFCANQTFPYMDQIGHQRWILSRMASEQRAGEVPHLRAWIEEQNEPFLQMTDFNFEGCGDAIWDYEGDRLFLGHGYRTSPEVRSWLGRLIAHPITALELKSEHFYHLDTCFFVLNRESCAYVKEAFAQESVDLIERSFKHSIPLDFEEAKFNFAGNAFCPNGQHVLLQKGSNQTVRALRELGFEPIEVETSEFMKSGGSVFCMKQAFWD